MTSAVAGAVAGAAIYLDKRSHPSDCEPPWPVLPGVMLCQTEVTHRWKQDVGFSVR